MLLAIVEILNTTVQFVPMNMGFVSPNILGACLKELQELVEMSPTDIKVLSSGWGTYSFCLSRLGGDDSCQLDGRHICHEESKLSPTKEAKF